MIKLLQDWQKCNRKGHFESWPLIASWNLFYDKSCIFSKELTWHRSPLAKFGGNWSKIGFKSLFQWNLGKDWIIFKFGTHFNKWLVGSMLDFFLILPNPKLLIQLKQHFFLNDYNSWSTLWPSNSVLEFHCWPSFPNRNLTTFDLQSRPFYFVNWHCWPTFNSVSSLEFLKWHCWPVSPW